ncbi:MAG TPA: hypothetical protein VK644_12810 [Chitinophagaceae bacterium]|jgi:hypothetical protein|nr:hypothetical protein [Chitinophagaceae bacterium]
MASGNNPATVNYFTGAVDKINLTFAYLVFIGRLKTSYSLFTSKQLEK